MKQHTSAELAWHSPTRTQAVAGDKACSYKPSLGFSSLGEALRFASQSELQLETSHSSFSDIIIHVSLGKPGRPRASINLLHSI